MSERTDSYGFGYADNILVSAHAGARGPVGVLNRAVWGPVRGAPLAPRQVNPYSRESPPTAVASRFAPRSAKPVTWKGP